MPGQLLGIMGASGSGKSTLLNVLTARNLSGLDVKGCIYINGQSVDAAEIKRNCAYVQQHDIFLGALTVREHLFIQVQFGEGTSRQDNPC
jgi:ABC-type multidrug transport system ATPase subunit